MKLAYPVDATPTITSAVYDQTIRNLQKQADDTHTPFNEAAAHKAAEEAEARHVFGHDAKKDSNGNWIPQGIGAWPHHVTMNSLNAIRRWEGNAVYQKMLRKLWKECPARAKAINCPEPDRLSA